MDATHRSELRESNDLNVARSDAKLDQPMTGLRAELRALKTELIKLMFLFSAGTLLIRLLLR